MIMVKRTAAPAPPPTGGDPNDNIGPTILGLGWFLASVSIIIVALRFYVRALVVRSLRLDDWTMLISLALGIVNTAFVSVAIHYGLGRHIDVAADPTNAIKWDYLAQPTAIMAPAIGRISFALLLLSISGTHKARRWMLYSIMASQFVVNSVTFILILVQCQPIELLWDKTVDGHCWDLRVQEYTGYFQGSFNSVTDLFLAVYPAFIVWHLNMKLGIRLSLIGLMGLGVFAMIGSIVKTIMLNTVGSSTDYTYNTSKLIVWWTIELYLVVIAASIPTLKPLVSKKTGSKATSGQGTYGMNTFNSRKAAGYRQTGPRVEDRYPSSGMSDDGSSQKKILQDYASDSPGDIRQTVRVSIDIRDASSRQANV